MFGLEVAAGEVVEAFGFLSRIVGFIFGDEKVRGGVGEIVDVVGQGSEAVGGGGGGWAFLVGGFEGALKGLFGCGDFAYKKNGDSGAIVGLGDFGMIGVF